MRRKRRRKRKGFRPRRRGKFEAGGKILGALLAIGGIYIIAYIVPVWVWYAALGTLTVLLLVVLLWGR